MYSGVYSTMYFHYPNMFEKTGSLPPSTSIVPWQAAACADRYMLFYLSIIPCRFNCLKLAYLSRV